jgi:hypothetical protein
MSTINRLSSVDVLQPSDQIPVWDSSNGDTRKASMSTLLAFVESYFADPDYSTRIVAPSVDYFNVDIGATGDSIWMIVNPVLNFTTGTITLPSTAYAVNDQEITVVFTAAVINFSITSSGATVLGAPATINGYDSFRVRYNASQQTWYTLDTTGDGSGAGGVSQIVRQDFTGDGATTTFTLTTAPSGLGNELQIFIDGVYQERSSYAVAGFNIIFSEAPPSLSNIEVLGWSVSIGTETSANLVSYTPAGTGAVVTTVQTKLREYVSVKDFGAVGDGVANDTAAIQAACSAHTHVLFPAGNYLIFTPINVNKTGFKAFGESEGNTTITADPSFTGAAMFNLGDGVTSRYFNEIRNLAFNGGSVVDIIGVYLNKVNNQSKIMHCSFDLFGAGTNGCAIKAENLALSNVVAFNKFLANFWDIWLVGTAGNSWNIMANYFGGGGRVYFQDAMTDVKYTNNVSDNGSRIFGDGASGQRGMHITGNRFESAFSAHIPIKFEIVRGCYISDNFFTGSGAATHAIEMNNTFADQYATIANNSFENFTTNYVISVMPADTLELYGNHANATYTTSGPEYVTNQTFTKFQHNIGVTGLRTPSGVGPLAVENKEATYIIDKQLAGAGATESVFTVTNSADTGSYTVMIDVLVTDTPTSTAVAAASISCSWVRVTGSAGASSDSALRTDRAFAVIATDAATRDIDSLAGVLVSTSGTVSTFQLTTGTTGTTTNLIARCSIKVIYQDYAGGLPVIAAV